MVSREEHRELKIKCELFRKVIKDLMKHIAAHVNQITKEIERIAKEHDCSKENVKKKLKSLFEERKRFLHMFKVIFDQEDTIYELLTPMTSSTTDHVIYRKFVKDLETMKYDFDPEDFKPEEFDDEL